MGAPEVYTAGAAQDFEAIPLSQVDRSLNGLFKIIEQKGVRTNIRHEPTISVAKQKQARAWHGGHCAKQQIGVVPFFLST